MNWPLVLNDLKRNKVLNVTLLLFMTLAALLVTMSIVLASQTFSSIDRLYQTAQPPHFLQLHKGEIDQTMVDQFMLEQEDVIDWQTVTMLTMHGEDLFVESEESTTTLADSQLDIGVMKQPAERDLLLDSHHQRIELAEGEIGMPIILKDRYDLQLGDQITLSYGGITKQFTLTNFVIDAQMNSTLASSTRVLLSDADYDTFYATKDEVEHIIEVYFTDQNMASSFQTRYENAGMPRNGQAITYTMMFLISALTDILTVFVMLLVSILLIVIAFISLKFTIMSALADDIHEIGLMKATGFNQRDIVGIYLNKYRILATSGVVIGFGLAVVLSPLITERVSDTFGHTPLSMLTYLFAMGGGVLVYILLTWYCRRMLKRIKHVSVVDALVHGRGIHREESQAKDGLHRLQHLPINVGLGLRDVRYHFRDWSMITGVVIVALLMIQMPLSLLSTLKSPEFVTYMGSEVADVLVEIEFSEELAQNYQTVMSLLEEDEQVERLNIYKRLTLSTEDSDNQWVNVSVDVGENAGNDLHYVRGHAPFNANEVALSVLNAEKLDKHIGDSMKVMNQGQEHNYLITGIYQDVTSGGYTAKASDLAIEAEPFAYTMTVNLSEDVNPTTFSDGLAQQVSGNVSIAPMAEFLNQTLGGVAKQLEKLVWGALYVSLSIISIILVLFLQLRLARDKRDIAVLKALGFLVKDIQIQYITRIMSVALIGSLLASLLSLVTSNPLINLVLSVSGLGINNITLFPNFTLQYILWPILTLLIIFSVTSLILQRIQTFRVVQVINE